MLRGNLYGVRIGNEFISCELNCEITITREMINKTGSWSGQAKAFRYGYYEWSITCDARSFLGSIGSSLNNLLDAQLNGVILDVFIDARTSNTQSFQLGGKVLIPALSIAFPNNGYSTFNITFQGTGDLTANADFWTIINAMPITADKPYIVNTTQW